MDIETARTELKRITDKVLGGGSHVEGTLQRGEFYIYTGVWLITKEQLERLQAEINILDISVDGYTLKLTAKV